MLWIIFLYQRLILPTVFRAFLVNSLAQRLHIVVIIKIKKTAFNVRENLKMIHLNYLCAPGQHESTKKQNENALKQNNFQKMLFRPGFSGIEQKRIQCTLNYCIL